MINQLKDIITIKVRGYHLDLYGHVNNTRYLEFLEEARWNIKEKYFNFPKSHEDGIGLVVVNTNINYCHPSKLSDVLEIHTYISKIGIKSCIFKHEIFNQSSKLLIANANVTFAIIDRNTEKAIKIPKLLHDMFNKLTITKS